MAQYQIKLESNINANVRAGKVFKKRTGLFNHWPWSRFNSEVRIGYIITVKSVLQKIETEYHLLKTRKGRWLAEADHEPGAAVIIQGKWKQHMDDFITLSIKSNR